MLRNYPTTPSGYNAARPPAGAPLTWTEAEIARAAARLAAAPAMAGVIERLGPCALRPGGDLGFQIAVQNAYGLHDRPRAADLRRTGEPWRPWRSAATWYVPASRC